jgi:predicted RNase H-like nuclease (RuvC/YqgF family)
VPLVKAVQELSDQNEKLKKQNEEQQQINSDLQNRLAKLEATMNVQQSTTNAKPQTANLSSVSLAQNIPNPFQKQQLSITVCRKIFHLHKLP